MSVKVRNIEGAEKISQNQQPDNLVVQLAAFVPAEIFFANNIKLLAGELAIEWE